MKICEFPVVVFKIQFDWMLDLMLRYLKSIQRHFKNANENSDNFKMDSRSKKGISTSQKRMKLLSEVGLFRRLSPSTIYELNLQIEEQIFQAGQHVITGQWWHRMWKLCDMFDTFFNGTKTNSWFWINFVLYYPKGIFESFERKIRIFGFSEKRRW